MLKAVRFDPDYHKDLIDFIETYKDKKGKTNHSEAIRLLMEEGLKSLQKDKEPQTQPTPNFDIEKIKQDILKDVMASIISSNQYMHAHSFPQVNNQTNNEPVAIEKKQAPQTAKKPTLPTNGNPLIANLLANSQR